MSQSRLPLFETVGDEWEDQCTKGIEMPSMIILFNVSRDCVLNHHGVALDQLEDRIQKMRPFAEEFIQAQMAARPDWTLDIEPQELDCRRKLVFPSTRFEGVSHGSELLWLMDAIDDVNYDIGRYIPFEPSVIEALTPDDVCLLKLLTSKVTKSPVSVMAALDEVLARVHAVSPLNQMDFLVEIDDSIPGAEVIPVRNWPHPEPIGFVLQLGSPISAAVVVHEAVHVLGVMRNCYEETGSEFIAALSEVLAAVRECEATAAFPRIIFSDQAEAAPCRDNPDILCGGRWRLGQAGDKTLATWHPHGADKWASESKSHLVFMLSLNKDERYFAAATLC